MCFVPFLMHVWAVGSAINKRLPDFCVLTLPTPNQKAYEILREKAQLRI